VKGSTILFPTEGAVALSVPGARTIAPRSPNGRSLNRRPSIKAAQSCDLCAAFTRRRGILHGNFAPVRAMPLHPVSPDGAVMLDLLLLALGLGLFGLMAAYASGCERV